MQLVAHGSNRVEKARNHLIGDHMPNTDMLASENVFREVDGRYIHNNEEISREEFLRRKAAVDKLMGTNRPTGRTTPRTIEDRRKSAFDEISFKRGGRAKVSREKSTLKKTSMW